MASSIVSNRYNLLKNIQTNQYCAWVYYTSTFNADHLLIYSFIPRVKADKNGYTFKEYDF